MKRKASSRRSAGPASLDDFASGGGDSPLDESAGDEVDAVADEVFERFPKPDLPDDPEPDEDEKYVDAIEAEHQQLRGALKHADEVETSDRLKRTARAAASGMDVNYFFCVVFVSEDQVIQFLKSTKWDRYGGTRYINGVRLAQELGVPLEPAYLATASEPDKALTEYETKRKSHGTSRHGRPKS